MSNREIIAELLKTRGGQRAVVVGILTIIFLVKMGVPLLAILFFPIMACITLWLALTIPKRRQQ